MGIIRIPLDRARLTDFCRKWKITRMAFFGSVLRDDFRPDSDVDVGVFMKTWRSSMSPRDKDLGYVWDMCDAASQVLEFPKGKSFEEYSGNKMLRLAVERLLEIIGQAGKEVSPELRDRYSDVPWARIVGLRNVLAHEYGEVKDEKIYLVATRDILH